MATPIKVVAAEAVYGDIAEQIGGSYVTVTSILVNPAQDPHEFEPTIETATEVARADVVIYNDAVYDSWMKSFGTRSLNGSRVIEVARFAHRRDPNNPHYWYDIDAVVALGDRLALTFTRIAPAGTTEFAARHKAFANAMNLLRARIAAMRSRYVGVAITSTEPLFGYLSDALGLDMRNLAFQRAVMTGNDPNAREVAQFTADLHDKLVKALIYNKQTSSEIAVRMRELASRCGIPVVVVAEVKPPYLRYQDWMTSQLDSLERALATP